MLQDLELHTSLVLEPLLVADELDRDDLAGLVVHAFQRLAEAALAQELNHFEAVRDVVLQNHAVVAALVVVAAVVRLQRRPLDLVRRQSKEVHLLIVKDFAFFKVCQLVDEELQGAGRGYGKRHFV